MNLAKKRDLNTNAMITSGIVLGAVGLFGDGEGVVEDSVLITSFLGCIGTGINSIRLAIKEHREKKFTRGR